MTKTDSSLGIFQRTLLVTYRAVNATGILKKPLVQQIFQTLYWQYKKHAEDPFAALIQQRPQLFKGGSILDIGANIGYTATLFSQAIDPSYRVYAFEPEADNLHSLQSVLKRRALETRIIPVAVAVGDSTRTAELWINPGSHADHRIQTDHFKAGEHFEENQIIQMVSIDDFSNDHPEISPIAFIKIDVQGFEEPVCRGMTKTLLAHPNAAVAIEYSPEGIAAMGFNPEDLLSFFDKRGYQAHHIARSGKIQRVSASMLRNPLPAPGYLDLLYLRHPLTEEANSW
jgi:FkbM family methyltransferase